jgi:hypothetical protein
MLYNEPISYNEPFTSYNGTVLIYAPSLQNPITLNNITVFYKTFEDYSNLTTIGITSLEVMSQGTIVIEILDNQIEAFMALESVAVVGENQVIINP